jgi:hypothetical protein
MHDQGIVHRVRCATSRHKAFLIKCQNLGHLDVKYSVQPLSSC